MERKKINLSTFILIFAIIIIIVMGMFIYKLYNDKMTIMQKSDELQMQINNLNETISELQGKMYKELNDSEKKELFDKAVRKQLEFIDTMISVKDFSQKNFTDKEILMILPESSEYEIFSPYDDGVYGKASIIDVEKSVKKLFDKAINVKSLQNNDTIKIINEEVVVGLSTGFGVLNAELISIDTIGNNEYKIKFKFDSGDGPTETYNLTISYNNGNIIYKSFEK